MGKIKMELFVHERDVTTIFQKLQNELSPFVWDKISIGNCGWASAPDCWWMRFPVTIEQRRDLVDWILENEFDIYNPVLIC